MGLWKIDIFVSDSYLNLIGGIRIYKKIENRCFIESDIILKNKPRIRSQNSVYILR